MEKSKEQKTRSLRRVALGAILLSALIILILSVLIELVLFVYPTMENYKREMNHEGDYASSIIGQEYLEFIFDKVKTTYNNTPEEIRARQYEDDYVAIVRPIVDDDFLAARKVLTSLREEAEMMNVYYTFFDEENQRLVFVIDGNHRDYAFLPGMWISNDNGEIDSLDKIQRTLKSSWYMPISYGKAWGWNATDYTEVLDSEGNVMGYMTINVPVNSVARQIGIFLAIYIPVMLILMVVFVIAASRFMTGRMLDPVNKMADAAVEYTNISKIDKLEATNIFKDLNIHTNDEIEELWKTFVDMENDVSDAMKQIRDVTAKQERIATELDLARNIQAAALPTEFKEISDPDKFELFASMTPAKEVGGDFYDFFQIDDDHLGLVIADVAGKGIPAALFMMISMSLIKTRTMEGGKPSEILAFVNDCLYKDNDNEMFVTVWLGILTISTGVVVAANAGHEYPFVTDENGKYQLLKEPHGIVIGAMEGMKYTDYLLTIPKGGRLFVYTDGIAEAQNVNDELFGLERMKECLNRDPGADPETVIHSMKKAVDDYAGDAEQFDDITMLSLWYKG